jgi:UDP-glucuronate decarboxylase
MRIVVTGGAGFIGSHLCDYLINIGHEIICIDNLFTSKRQNISHLLTHPNFEFFRHDVCDPWHIECDQIYHLACPASPIQYQRNPVQTMKTAFLGTLNSLECARNTRAKFLVTSTSEIYGDPLVHPQTEEYWGNVNPIGPRSMYDEGKRAGEALAVSWKKQHGTDIRISRLFNTYGERLDPHDGRVVSNFINQALNKLPITVYGDGSQTRSFCYVKDTVSCLYKLMEAKFSPEEIPVFNIGNPEERTILSVANYVNKKLGDKVEIKFESLPLEDPKQRKPDISKATKILGWKPTTSYEEGIGRTINWFQTLNT